MRLLTEIPYSRMRGDKNGESPVYINLEEVAFMRPWVEEVYCFVNAEPQEPRKGTEITMRSGQTFIVKETIEEIQNMAEGREKDGIQRAMERNLPVSLA